MWKQLIILSEASAPFSSFVLASILLQSLKELTDTRRFLIQLRGTKSREVTMLLPHAVFHHFHYCYEHLWMKEGRECVADAILGCRVCSSSCSGSCSRAWSKIQQCEWDTLQTSSQKPTAILSCNSRTLWWIEKWPEQALRLGAATLDSMSVHNTSGKCRKTIATRVLLPNSISFSYVQHQMLLSWLCCLFVSKEKFRRMRGTQSWD